MALCRKPLLLLPLLAALLPVSLMAQAVSDLPPPAAPSDAPLIKPLPPDQLTDTGSQTVYTDQTTGATALSQSTDSRAAEQRRHFLSAHGCNGAWPPANHLSLAPFFVHHQNNGQTNASLR